VKWDNGVIKYYKLTIDRDVAIKGAQLAWHSQVPIPSFFHQQIASPEALREKLAEVEVTKASGVVNRFQFSRGHLISSRTVGWLVVTGT